MIRTSAFTAALLLAAAPVYAQDSVQGVTVDKLEDKNLYDSAGKNIADIDELVIGPDKKVFAVVQYGGFLGLGAEEKLLPAEGLSMDGDKIVFTGKTADDLKGLQAWKDGQEGFSELEDSFVTPVQMSAATPPADAAAPANPPVPEATPAPETPESAPEAPAATPPPPAPPAQ